MRRIPVSRLITPVRDSHQLESHAIALEALADSVERIHSTGVVTSPMDALVASLMTQHGTSLEEHSVSTESPGAVIAAVIAAIVALLGWLIHKLFSKDSNSSIESIQAHGEQVKDNAQKLLSSGALSIEDATNNSHRLTSVLHHTQVYLLQDFKLAKPFLEYIFARSSEMRDLISNVSDAVKFLNTTVSHVSHGHELTDGMVSELKDRFDVNEKMSLPSEVIRMAERYNVPTTNDIKVCEYGDVIKGIVAGARANGSNISPSDANLIINDYISHGSTKMSSALSKLVGTEHDFAMLDKEIQKLSKSVEDNQEFPSELRDAVMACRKITASVVKVVSSISTLASMYINDVDKLVKAISK